MKLLFNRDEAFSEEAKNILGFIDADVEFQEIRSDIKSASRSFKKIFGTELYDQFLEIYWAVEVEEVPDPEPDPVPDPEPEPDPAPEEVFELTDDQAAEILEQIQTVILLDAYRVFIVNRDLAHTPGGRKMRVDENQKLPFDWMLDRSNANLDRKFYTAIDELLELIEILPTWVESDSYELMHSTWVNSTAQLQEFYPQGNRMLLLKLAPGLKRAQDKDVSSRLPSLIYKTINDAIKTGAGVQDTELSEILDKAREAMVYYAIHWALIRLRVTIFPEGILQAYTGDRNTTKARKVPEGDQIELVATAFKNDSDKSLLELEELVKKQTPVTIEAKPLRKHILGNADDNFIAL